MNFLVSLGLSVVSFTLSWTDAENLHYVKSQDNLYYAKFIKSRFWLQKTDHQCYPSADILFLP